MVFFSKNRKTALKRIKELQRTERYYKNKTIKLASKQIPHISAWKTWEVVKKRWR